MPVHRRWLPLGAALVLAATSAYAIGPECPTEHGACFIPLSVGYAFVNWDEPSDYDNDGDVDYLMVIADGFNDFYRLHSNGKLFGHLNERDATMIYCPFYPFDAVGDFVPPDASCAFGTGRASINGYLTGDAFGICPAVVNMAGKGVRPWDGGMFKFSSRLVINGNCGIVQARIKDNMP